MRAMTKRMRLLLAWLMMAAIPLQGFAAASTLFCRAFAQDVEPHSMHAGSPDHDSRHLAGSSNPVPDDAKQVSPGAESACIMCAACGHALAIAEIPSVVAATIAPRAGVADPFVLIGDPHPPVPDKPPRT